MSTTFTASNGVVIDDLGYCIGGPADDERRHAARIEFYRHLEDERLGRWRWPENPEYVVYPTPSGEVVTVLKESTGHSGQFDREQFAGMMAAFESSDPGYSRAARAYFEAHPEPKPWHTAKPGEAWVLTVDGDEYPWGVGDGVDAGRFVYLGGLSNLPIDHPSITAGRRIWPEGDA